MRVVAPTRSDETAGHLGYYARTKLPQVFDLMDLDGCWPAGWVYRRAETRQFRFFEEKPDTDRQSLHETQHRTLRDLASMPRISCYVIWRADRLSQEPPQFPIEVTRLAPNKTGDTTKVLGREQFDRWLTSGLAPTKDVAGLPYVMPDTWPGTEAEWLDFERNLTKYLSA